MLTSSFDEILGQRRRDCIEVFEHKPAAELVASKDIVRVDGLGRQVVACPAGMPPPAWLVLSTDERPSLVEPPPPIPPGTMRRSGGFGFTLEGVSVGPTGFVD